MASTMLLGELLVHEGIVTQDCISDALRIQVEGNRRMGNILLRMGVLTSDELADALAEQLGTEPTDIEATFSDSVRKVLPRYLCCKYDVLPLALKDHNILLTAMSDPSDNEAVTDIEHYTGKVVERCLARQSDISKVIAHKIPYSYKDFFNPQANTYLTRVIATAAFALVIVLGVTGYNYVDKMRYGTVTHKNNTTTYMHRDLILGFKESGSISLMGRSAFSDGYYSASFADIPRLMAFVASSKDQFSNEQKNWVRYVMAKEKAHGSLNAAVASNTNQ